MEDGKISLKNPPEILLESGMAEEHSSSIDSMLSAGFLNDCLGDAYHHQQQCSHMHTCNPPGPDNSHTHTCFHVHTKIVPAPTDENADSSEQNANASEPAKKSRKGNCEAVRKYRLRKKARAASLEEEVLQLREMNQQLIKRLQNQAALEAEVARLRCLLVDMRGRIEGEIGSFPYQKPMSINGNFVNSSASMGMVGGGAQVVNPCNFSCDEQIHCLQTGMQGRGGGEANGQSYGACGIGNVQCMSDFGSEMDNMNCGRRNMAHAGCTSTASMQGAHGRKEG